MPIVITSVNNISNKGKENYSTVGIDDVKSAYNATEYIINKGHKNIAMMIGEKNDFGISWWRYKGFVKALEKHGLESNRDNVLIGDYSPSVAYEEAKKYLMENKDTTAIFAISDRMAIGVAKAVSDLGLVVGKDISIVGFDGLEESEFYTPGITTVKQPKKELATQSVELLFDLLKGEKNNEHIILDTNLVERESCNSIKR